MPPGEHPGPDPSPGGLDSSPIGQDLTATHSFLGTPAYMAPEQVLGEAAITPTTDTYAFGVVLYEMVTGSLRARPAGAGRQRPLLARARADRVRPPGTLISSGAGCPSLEPTVPVR